MQNFLKKLFNTKKIAESMRQIEYEQISVGWNANPVSPDIILEISGDDLIIDIYLNYYVYEGYRQGDKVKIIFKNCASYSLNSCNDEGYYYGQYRIKPNQLPWGEFFEIKSGVDRNFPKPVTLIDIDKENKRHFIFFFKDETFECLADDYTLDFYNVNNEPVFN